MAAPFPFPIATWHNDTYQAISPSRPELSASEKTVVITGAVSQILSNFTLSSIYGRKHVKANNANFAGQRYW